MYFLDYDVANIHTAMTWRASVQPCGDESHTVTIRSNAVDYFFQEFVTKYHNIKSGVIRGPTLINPD